MDARAQQMAATIAGNSFYVGGNWGFMPVTNAEYNEIMDILDSDTSIKSIPVENGYIVYCDYNYLAQVISQVDRTVTQDILSRVNTRKSVEITELQKFMTTIVKGTSKYMVPYDSFEECSIGIYCVNSMHKTRVNGVEYPAYSLELEDTLKELSKLTRMVVVYVKTDNGFEDINSVIRSGNYERVYNGIEISNSNTCAFLTIRIQKR